MTEILVKGSFKEYTLQCLSCHTLFKFTRQEATKGDDDHLHIKCPECFKICWTKE